MHAVQVRDYPAWRSAARSLLQCGVAPEDVSWDEVHEASLQFPSSAGREADAIRIPRSLLDLLETCACHRDPRRWAFMYRVLWRAARNGERRLLSDAADPDVGRLRAMEKAVTREVHEMHAFVRFRETADDSGRLFVAWFEPEHDILRRSATFFRDRFASMRWMIATPALAATWDGHELRYVDGPHARPDLEDGSEELWRAYYASTFNPARLNERLMAREMPRRYWPNLPEARTIAALSRDAASRAETMQAATGGAPRWATRVEVPRPALQAGLQGCRRCPLWERATQPVAGAGPSHARIMLVGEQPGDEEDLRGAPFVGPAGKILDRALTESQLQRDTLFVTNAVKHFKWEPRGKRRLHKTPAQQEIEACSVWLDEEIRRVSPRVIVALGATAAQALTGQRLPIASARGRVLHHPGGAKLLVTYHPSAILRSREGAEDLFDALREDLRRSKAEAQEDHGPVPLD